MILCNVNLKNTFESSSKKEKNFLKIFSFLFEIIQKAHFNETFISSILHFLISKPR